MTPHHRRLFFRKRYTLMYAHHEHGSGMDSHATNPASGYGDGRQGHKIDLRKGRTRWLRGRFRGFEMTPSIRNLIQAIEKGSGASSNLKGSSRFSSGGGSGAQGHYYEPMRGVIIRCTGGQDRQSSNPLVGGPTLDRVYTR